MKYRIKYNLRRGRWMLQTPPATSSAWDEIADSNWRWPLRLYARWYTACRVWREDTANRRAVIEEFEL